MVFSRFSIYGRIKYPDLRGVSMIFEIYWERFFLLLLFLHHHLERGVRKQGHLIFTLGHLEASQLSDCTQLIFRVSSFLLP